MVTPFEGFPKAGLDFLTELGTEDKAWFDANRKVYDAEVVAPAKAYVEAMGERLRVDFGEGIVAQPKTNGSIAPINNDVRFNPEASAYKDHLMFRFWEGATKKTSPLLMVRLHPKDGVGFASGMRLTDLNTWREAVADDRTGPPLAEAIESLMANRGMQLEPPELKKVPKPFDPDHPRGELLRNKGFQIRFVDKVPKRSIIGSDEFVDWSAERLAKFIDVHQWLVKHL